MHVHTKQHTCSNVMNTHFAIIISMLEIDSVNQTHIIYTVRVNLEVYYIYIINMMILNLSLQVMIFSQFLGKFA